MKKMITVIAPMYNESEGAEKYAEVTLAVLKQIEDMYDYEILFVNDGSKDDTYKKQLLIQKNNPEHVGVVNLTRNFGLEGAVHAGLSKAQGDVMIVMDADLQDPPLLILEMVKKWEAGADVVIASRASRKKDSFVKRTTADLYYKILDSLSGKLKLERSAANYRLLSRKAVDTLLSLPEVNTYFRVDVPYIGMKTDVVEYERDLRFAGKTKYNFKSLIGCAFDGLTSISVVPLLKLTQLPIIPIFTFIASIICIIFCPEKTKSIAWNGLLLSFFFFFVFMAIAVIGQYIAQIMLETRGRPVSIVYEYNPSKTAGKR